MRTFISAQLLAVCFFFSHHASAQTAIELRWDFSTGSGTGGSNSIIAEKGDQLSLLIVVKDKSSDGIGLLGAALSASYDTDYLEHIRFHECPNPPNDLVTGSCNDLLGTVFEPYLPGLFVSAGTAYNFDAYSEKNKAGYFNGNNDEMVIGRMNFRVTDNTDQAREVVSIFYDPVSGEAIVDGHNVIWKPTASAVIRPPPPGCQ